MATEKAAEEKAQARAERAAPRERESATDHFITYRFIKNAASSVGRQLGSQVARSIGNAIIRGILGWLTRK